MKIYGVDGKHVQEYLKFHNHNEQVDILQEECAELIQALSKLKRYGLDEVVKRNVLEEMTHTLISIASVATILGITEEDIDKQTNAKNPKC